MKREGDLTIGQETWKQLVRVHQFVYSYANVFEDSVDTCLASLLFLTGNIYNPDIIDRLMHYKLSGKYEERYLQMVAKYPENKEKKQGERTIDFMTLAWGKLIREVKASSQDILGELFMTNISFGEHGQFFTPPQITDLMAQMVSSDNGAALPFVCDPCCGSGRFFLSIAKLQPTAHFYGVDVAQICAKMTALNMWLFDLNADIYHGNSLSMDMQHVWKIRKGGFIYEAKVEKSADLLPKQMKEQLHTKAEQQRLFREEDGN